MSNSINKTGWLLVGSVIGSALLAGVFFAMGGKLPNSDAGSKHQIKPLYWVAPMDSNYRRDKPGKSPMGMDLVPVYPEETKSNTKEPKILYWVAPMDANYRRDKPGKSPMGMDLVPVYEEQSNVGDFGPGTIKISPEVINNLGVRTSFAKVENLLTNVKTVGYVKYNKDELVHIHPRVMGWIDKLYVKAQGERVKKGQPLYQIYSPNLVNAQEELVIALGRKNDRLIKAAEERLKALQLPKRAIRKLKKNKRAQQKITFYAPQSGVVENLNIREGFYVQPGTTLMSIASLKQVWVEAEIFERQAFMIELGSPVEVTLDYQPGKSWQGKVDYIYPYLDPKTRTVKARIRLDNPEGDLKPNMFTQLLIKPLTDSNALVVPKEAVIRSGSMNRVVLALSNGRYKSIEVKLGRSNKNYFEILDGINDGDEIVTSAHFLLDSESSKSSDFKRMQPRINTTKKGNTESTNKTAWVEAKINSLMPNHKMINVDHKPIEVWGWPDMTMDFMVDDGVDISKLSPGMTIHVEIEKQVDEQYKIVNVHIPALQEDVQDTDHSAMNHGSNQQATTEVDHAAMGHASHQHATTEVDHAAMGHDMTKEKK